MNTVLRNERPTSKQMYLDPRTKILLCLTVSSVMLASDNTGLMEYVNPCLAIVPLIFLAIMRKPLIIIYYVGMYLFSMTIPYILLPYLPPLFNLLFTGVVAMSTKLLPGMSMFVFLILTTTVSEFIAAMDSLHIPKKITIPVSVMFRFFPTIREEYTAIRDAMQLRNIGSWQKPMKMLEYRMVPLLMGLVQIGNELSASALTRGLNAPIRRTNICPIGFHWQDVMALIFCLGVISAFTLSLAFGW